MEPLQKKLLAIELWGLGDLIIATPFLQAASRRYSVTLLAKPYAKDLGSRFWPEVKVVPFVAPWTAFQQKYRLYAWPWQRIFQLRKLRREHFDIGISARWDPRDHFLLKLARVRMRLGYPRILSQMFLNRPLARPDPAAHRYEYWRTVGTALDLDLPTWKALPSRWMRRPGKVLIHSGAGQPVRVWPLERYQAVVARLRKLGHTVQVACDPDQHDWWRRNGEAGVATPRSVSQLLGVIDEAVVFIGNDSGPAHLAAYCGIPTFTLFGPQLPERFAPLHPAGECLEGKPCPYKPCSDYCRFEVPYCIVNWSEEEVWVRLVAFLSRTLPLPAAQIRTDSE
jgi:heptosyltransferase-2